MYHEFLMPYVKLMSIVNKHLHKEIFEKKKVGKKIYNEQKQVKKSNGQMELSIYNLNVRSSMLNVTMDV
jgi:hypothetical protein